MEETKEQIKKNIFQVINASQYTGEGRGNKTYLVFTPDH